MCRSPPPSPLVAKTIPFPPTGEPTVRSGCLAENFQVQCQFAAPVSGS
jgi:hypothetical protein